MTPLLDGKKSDALLNLKRRWKERWFNNANNELIEQYPQPNDPNMPATVQAKDKKFVVELYANDSLLERARKMATISLKTVLAPNAVDEAMIDRAAFGVAQALDIYARSDNEQKRKQQNTR